MLKRCKLLLRLILILALVALVHCGISISQPECHLIPEGYVGDVFILFDQPHGDLPRQEGLCKTYRIPSSGILSLRVSVDDNSGFTLRRYYYITAKGTRKQLPGYWVSSIARTRRNWVDPDVGVSSLNSGKLWTLDLGCEIPYSHYFVGTQRQAMERRTYGTDILEAYAKLNQICTRGKS